jgi:Rps23 Pro-64 3,4-dihydroxylase Tpa1-like proline 4-hydroxylase
MDGRLCAILVYLNKEYTNGDGGELKVNDKTIEPIFGDVVIMDYTKNNVEHSVNEVLNDKFKRRAILYFANI